MDIAVARHLRSARPEPQPSGCNAKVSPRFPRERLSEHLIGCDYSRIVNGSSMKAGISRFDKTLLYSLCTLDCIKTGIIVFYTGSDIPDYATEMLRDPLPIGRGTVNDQFLLVLQEALATNPSIHDGAIMCGRTSCIDDYEVVGWSYRLHPPPNEGIRVPNKGSGFNSSLAMSLVNTVDRVLYWSSRIGWCFESGSTLGPVHK